MSTPTATLIAPAGLPRDRWLQVRRQGIGGSDLPAIAGCSKYRTKLHVYLEKRGEFSDDGGSEAARWGQLLEDVIAREWATRHGVKVRRVGTLAHRDHPWRLVNLDRLVAGCPDGRCALEVKTRNAWDAGSWRDDVPDDVLAQVQWELHVTGLDHVHVFALIGGQRPVHHILHPDQELIAFLVTEAADLWRHVQDGVPPAVDPSALLVDLLDRLHPHRDGTVEVDYAHAVGIAARHAAAAALVSEGEAAKEAAKAEAVALLGGADTAVLPGGEAPAWTYRPQNRAHVDTDRLKADWPDAYAATVTRKPTRPVLRFAKEITS